MTTFIAGGTGFIGRRLVPLLAQRGEEIVCMDINPQTADFGHLVPTIGGGGVVIQGWDEHPGSDADRADGAGAVCA